MYRVGVKIEFAAKIIDLNFNPLEVVSRYRDPQLQIGKNDSYLFNLRPNIYKKYWCRFSPNTSDLVGKSWLAM